ncbi:MAG: hypothetical protein RSE18_08460 [Acinetobacter sp.]
MSEKIIGVSIAYGAQVFSLLKPNRHMHIYEMLIHPKYPDLDSFNENIVEGFITSELNFLNRREAMVFAKQNGQIKDDTFQEHELFSEDLW